MILHDSVFIIEFILRLGYMVSRPDQLLRDPLMDEPCLMNTVKDDLFTLLENQLPYFILEKLFGLLLPTIPPYKSLRQMIISLFGFTDKISNNSTFKHFTDLIRCVRVETLPDFAPGTWIGHIKHMYNMEKLNSGGVKFEAVENDFSLCVRFDNGCLKIPCLTVYDELEMTLRNIMALEQCHYPKSAHVCNYVIFLDHLIDTDKDVNLLVEKGIIQNHIGEHRLVAEMVNKLCLGIRFCGSYYSDIAAAVNNYYRDPFNRSHAVLKSVYFGNLWTGTGTVAAMLLLLMTLIQTVASIIQKEENLVLANEFLTTNQVK
ncbi:unnamed protein product [Arabis nemorensis]|uniref:Uncharacterized protein n=1 Tax=Arabis nemorensis TaxID=586526 RepID=A0A565BYH1_9BRAS|nr:unnamed protein product [Arabis nemorensis]